MIDSKSTKVETYPLIVKMIPEETLQSQRIPEKVLRIQERTIRLGKRSTIVALCLALWCVGTFFMGGSVASAVLTTMKIPEKTTTATTTATPDDRLVIIARYSEDVSWAPIYLDGRIPYEVCQKGDPIFVANASNPLPGFYVYPNKGTEALCYLSAIIKHYHNLPDQMAFVHGHRYAWHEDDNALNLLSYKLENRLPYASLSTMEFPSNYLNGAQVCLKRKYCDDQYIRAQGRETAFLWNNLLSDLLNMTTPETIRSSCCAQFVVTKERILEHPLEIYVRLARFLVEMERPDFFVGRVFEYLWHILFGMPAYYVDPPICERWHCNANGERIVPDSSSTTKDRNVFSYK